MDPARQRRRKEIGDALRFIQSSLPFPDQGGYQDFLIKLVCNLLKEGNCWFRDGNGNRAVREFSEALNVTHYASAGKIHIPQVLLERLYVNRATAYHSMKEYSQCVKDCDKAMEVFQKSHRLLYLKALCLKQLGKYKEAYDCTRECMLMTQDKQVNDLAEELANQLGQKRRHPYVSTRVGKHMNSLSQTAAVGLPSMPQSELHAKTNNNHTPAISGLQSMDTLEDFQLIGGDLDSLLDSMANKQEAAEVKIPILEVVSLPSRKSTSVLPAPTPYLPPAFFSSAISHLNTNSFGSHNSLDTLDDISSPQGHDSSNTVSGGVDAPKVNSTMLNSLGDLLKAPPCAKAAKADQSKTDLKAAEKSLDDLLVELKPVGIACDPSAPAGSVSIMNQLDSLDSLDLFPSVKGGKATLPVLPEVGTGLDQLCSFSSTGSSTVATSSGAVSPIKTPPRSNRKPRSTCTSVSNPLSATHEFMQACSTCFPRLGQGIFTFVHKPDLVHNCERDVLLCRRKAASRTKWTRVRQLPTRLSFTGPFVICRDVGMCKVGDKCTFAFNQLEIDVWTEERKGTLDRNLLFGPTPAVKLDPTNSIIRLVEENKGMFIFVCQECYDSKPRIISKRCTENDTLCSNADARHSFDANKCLAFVVRTTNVNYKKVRPLSVLARFEMCPQALRHSCLCEESCHYAHSVIELKTWRVQQDTGISPDKIVMVSTQYLENQEQSSRSQRFSRFPAANGEGKAKACNLNMKMNFACAQCWCRGNVSMPDKTLKHCSAKAKHTWTKEQCILLVKTLDKNKWVPVRPLPHTAKNFPMQYQMCNQILEKRKCYYSEKCTFAHSKEEKDMWMYMKNQNVRDMQQMYDMWLILSAHNRQADGAVLTKSVAEENYITMPTDNAEPMSGFYCRLCGKHSNGERQWQQHISTLKHRERVFSCEGEDETLTWGYRFPGSCFQLCSHLEGGCRDGASCDYAHSAEELQEWIERRDILRQRLAKAREDMLIMPDEFDFGKYNFLLQESDKKTQKN